MPVLEQRKGAGIFQAGQYQWELGGWLFGDFHGLVDPRWSGEREDLGSVVVVKGSENFGPYFRVLDSAPLYGLSLLTQGLERGRVTSISCEALSNNTRSFPISSRAASAFFSRLSRTSNWRRKRGADRVFYSTSSFRIGPHR